jgi:hypothetical protein
VKTWMAATRSLRKVLKIAKEPISLEAPGQLILPLVPAKAGTQSQELDSRLRGMSGVDRTPRSSAPSSLVSPGLGAAGALAACDTEDAGQSESRGNLVLF